MEHSLDLFINTTDIRKSLLEQQIEKLNLDKEKLLLKQQRSEEESISHEVTLTSIDAAFETLDFKEKHIMINNLIEQIYINQKYLAFLNLYFMYSFRVIHTAQIKNDSFCLTASITPCAANSWPVDKFPFHCNGFTSISPSFSAIPRTSTAHSLTLPIVMHFRQYVQTLLHLLHKNDEKSLCAIFPQR